MLKVYLAMRGAKYSNYSNLYCIILDFIHNVINQYKGSEYTGQYDTGEYGTIAGVI